MPTPFGTESCNGCRIQLWAPRFFKEIDQVVVLASVTPGRYFQFSSVEEQEILRRRDLEETSRPFQLWGPSDHNRTAEFPKGSWHRIEEVHLFRPIRNHPLSKILCLYFSIFICITKKVFRQPSMLCLSHDLQGKIRNNNKKQGLCVLPRTEMLSYWPDICHSQIHTKHELPHIAHGERAALHNEGWALQGQFCSQGFPASVQRAGVCLQCQLHWPLRTLSLKKTWHANFG